MLVEVWDSKYLQFGGTSDVLFLNDIVLVLQPTKKAIVTLKTISSIKTKCKKHGQTYLSITNIGK